MEKIICLSLASTENAFELKHFLKRHKQSSIQHNESVYIVRLKNEQHSSIIGVAKLAMLPKDTTSTYWLRGLYVENSQRKKGYASQLLSFIAESVISQKKAVHIIAFPLKHLERLYQKQDYQMIPSTQLPPALVGKYLHQKGWLCMRFQSK